mgnify:CR=1 FL=1
MSRGWLVSLGAAGLVLLAAVVVDAAQRQRGEAAEAEAASDPCFRYGRFECCVRPDE